MFSVCYALLWRSTRSCSSPAVTSVWRTPAELCWPSCSRSSTGEEGSYVGAEFVCIILMLVFNAIVGFENCLNKLNLNKRWNVHLWLILRIITFMHLADTFIQSDLQCIQAIQFFFCQYVCSLGIEPTTFCDANAMLYHWIPGTLLIIDNLIIITATLLLFLLK